MDHLLNSLSLTNYYYNYYNNNHNGPVVQQHPFFFLKKRKAPGHPKKKKRVELRSSTGCMLDNPVERLLCNSSLFFLLRKEKAHGNPKERSEGISFHSIPNVRTAEGFGFKEY